jgi:hypothetical protein
MSFLELQSKAVALTVAERYALMQQLRDSLTENELETLQLKEAQSRYNELLSGKVERVTGEA